MCHTCCTHMFSLYAMCCHVCALCHWLHSMLLTCQSCTCVFTHHWLHTCPLHVGLHIRALSLAAHVTDCTYVCSTSLSAHICSLHVTDCTCVFSCQWLHMCAPHMSYCTCACVLLAYWTANVFPTRHWLHMCTCTLAACHIIRPSLWLCSAYMCAELFCLLVLALKEVG